MPSVLFVCLGNICRSPTAEAVFRHKAKAARVDVAIESAGTGGWHEGDRPDPRAMQAGRARGYSFKGQSARAVRDTDFAEFDHIFPMDSRNYEDLMKRCPQQHRHKIRKFLDLTPQSQARDVPDPYYGGEGGFEHVLDLIEAASDALISELK